MITKYTQLKVSQAKNNVKMLEKFYIDFKRSAISKIKETRNNKKIVSLAFFRKKQSQKIMNAPKSEKKKTIKTKDILFKSRNLKSFFKIFKLKGIKQRITELQRNVSKNFIIQKKEKGKKKISLNFASIKLIMKNFRFKASKQKNTEQLRYLSQSVLLEEAITPHMIRSTLMVASITIIIFIVWAAVTEIDELTIAPGEVVPSQYIQSIQHLEGGIVSEIYIKEGDLVEKGQKLIKLNGASVKQDLSSLKAKQLALDYQSERLRAFVNYLLPDFDSISGGHEHLQKEQMKAYYSMVKSRDLEKNVIEEQITQKEGAIKLALTKENTLKRNLKLVKAERDIKQELVKQGALSKVKFFAIEKTLNDIKGEVGEIESKIQQAKNEVSEYRKRLDSLEARHRDEAYRELDVIESDSLQNKERIKKLMEQVERLEIRSPTYGLVKSLSTKTIGGVVSPGQLLVEVVPLDGNLLVESKISPKDIGHVKKGQNVSIKISAYDFSRYGVVPGELEYISATTFSADDDSRYYLGRVSLSKNYVGKIVGQNKIMPGMTVQSDIITGKKSVLAYLLKPIHSSLNSAFRER